MTTTLAAKNECGITIYGSVAKAAKLAGAVPAQRVMLHTTPDPTDSAAVAIVREAWPQAKLDFGIPGNTFADDTQKEIKAKARTMVDQAHYFGASTIQLNCEGASKPGWPGWKAKAGSPEATRLYSQALEVVFAFRTAINKLPPGLNGEPALRLSFTSHDLPFAHNLPWGAFLSMRMDEHDPQIYPGLKRPGASAAAVMSRYQKATKQWDTHAEVEIHLGTAGTNTAGFGVYHQAWGMSVRSMIWLGTRTARNRMWSFPDDLWTPEGLLAAYIIARLKASYPVPHPTETVVHAFQRDMGLEVDGVFGRQSFREFQKLHGFRFNDFLKSLDLLADLERLEDMFR